MADKESSATPHSPYLTLNNSDNDRVIIRNQQLALADGFAVQSAVIPNSTTSNQSLTTTTAIKLSFPSNSSSSSSPSPPPTTFHLPSLADPLPPHPSQSTSQLEFTSQLFNSPTTSPPDMRLNPLRRSKSKAVSAAAAKLPLTSSSSTSQDTTLNATELALAVWEAKLMSSNKMEQKDAIRRVLALKVRNDWSWDWPMPEGRPRTPDLDLESGYPSESEGGWSEIESQAIEVDGQKWVGRTEWESLHEDSDDETANQIPQGDWTDEAKPKGHPKYESSAQKRHQKKLRHERMIREEMKVNDGVACYEHRRNAWTRARYVRRRGQESAITTSQGSTPSTSTNTAAPTPPLTPTDPLSNLHLLIPISPPIIPNTTAIRSTMLPFTKRDPSHKNSSNTPSTSLTTIYDRVVLQSTTPACPINLAVMMDAIVTGWKRDGEWDGSGVEKKAGLAAAVGVGASQGRSRRGGLRGALGGLGRVRTKSTQTSAVRKPSITSPTSNGTNLMSTSPPTNPDGTVPPATNRSLVRRSLDRVLGVVGHTRRGSEVWGLVGAAGVGGNAVVEAEGKGKDGLEGGKETGVGGG